MDSIRLRSPTACVTTACVFVSVVIMITLDASACQVSEIATKLRTPKLSFVLIGSN
jgi:hypothetical protein